MDSRFALPVDTVLDGGYQLSAGAPTDGELHSALRSATNLNEALPEPKDPQSTTPTLSWSVEQ